MLPTTSRRPVWVILAGCTLHCSSAGIADLAGARRRQYFNLAVLNNGVTARVCEASQAGTSPSAPRTNLLAISNVFGWAVVGTSSGAYGQKVDLPAGAQRHRAAGQAGRHRRSDMSDCAAWNS